LNKANGLLWRLQDAKAHFSAVVEGALRGVPQHVTRRGRKAVVVVSEQDFEALQRHAGRQDSSFIEHLRAIPKVPVVPKGGGVAAKIERTTGQISLALRDLDP